MPALPFESGIRAAVVARRGLVIAAMAAVDQAGTAAVVDMAVVDMAVVGVVAAVVAVAVARGSSKPD